MTKTSSVFALVGVGLSVLSSVMVVGCSKKEEAPAAPAPAQTTVITANGVQVQVREESGVSRYSDEGPEIGTVRTNRSLELRKSADNTSAVVGRVGPGIMVNKKARRGAFYLVDFPGAGGMVPGWLDQNEVTGGALPIVTATTTATTPPAVTTTAPPVATVAPPATTATIGRPPIRIPGKKLPRRQGRSS